MRTGNQRQMRICHPSRTMDVVSKRRAFYGQARRIGPEPMTGQRAVAPQHLCGLPGCDALREHASVAGNAHEARFRHGCGRPASLVDLREPSSRSCMVDMIRPGQRDEDVDVEQIRHASSIASRTISAVTGSASSQTTKVGKGESVACGRRPRSASSDTAAPKEIRFCRASDRAVSRTRSSMSRVVRITASYHQSIKYPLRLDSPIPHHDAIAFAWRCIL